MTTTPNTTRSRVPGTRRARLIRRVWFRMPLLLVAFPLGAVGATAVDLSMSDRSARLAVAGVAAVAAVLLWRRDRHC
jgi:hypothetical protein